MTSRHRPLTDRRHRVAAILLASALLGFGAIPATPQTASAHAPSVDTPRVAWSTTGETDETVSSSAAVDKFRKRLARPIKLGVSGGNATDIRPADEPGFVVCSSGTLGGLVLKNGVPHILSNNHVIAIQNDAEIGDPIDQPGLIDNGCRDVEDNYVGTLSAYKKLKFGGERTNRVDAAIAEIIEGTVDPRGRIQGIGIPGDVILEPELGMPVKKAGRTTGITRGTIDTIDATFNVEFGEEDNPRDARFVRQLLIAPSGETFVEGGDSGAIVFYDRRKCEQWVGLLFAGTDSGFGIVNPIKKVFSVLKKRKPKGPLSPIGCDSASVADTASLTAFSAAARGRTRRARLERRVRAARRIVEQRDDEILGLDGVVGIGVGL
ncbi:MAG: S1 family peptidase, partial [Acidobacteriota bacterium]|nr:S1 family peptidase [Acidobacteriota bacterium]